jgi:hypothetical protein
LNLLSNLRADDTTTPVKWIPLTRVTDAMRRKVPPDRDLREIPPARVRPVAKAIGAYASEYAERDGAMAAA